MSVAIPAKATPPATLGWRRTERTAPDGSTSWEERPLTLDDLLDPQEGDQRVQNLGHAMICVYFWIVLHARTVNVPRSVVLIDNRLTWERRLEWPEAMAPDVTLVYGLEHNRWVGTLRLPEGHLIDLAMEATSTETREQDLIDKRVYYHEKGVQQYVIVDTARPGRLALIGLRWAPDGYVQEELDERGRLWLPSVGLWLGAVGDDLVFHDGITGERFGDYATTRTQLSAANLENNALRIALALSQDHARRAEERALHEAEEKGRALKRAENAERRLRERTRALQERDLVIQEKNRLLQDKDLVIQEKDLALQELRVLFEAAIKDKGAPDSTN